MTWICSTCGNINDDTDSICQQVNLTGVGICGTPRPPISICSVCGKSNPAGTANCINCNYDLSKSPSRLTSGLYKGSSKAIVAGGKVKDTVTSTRPYRYVKTKASAGLAKAGGVSTGALPPGATMTYQKVCPKLLCGQIILQNPPNQADPYSGFPPTCPDCGQDLSGTNPTATVTRPRTPKKEEPSYHKEMTGWITTFGFIIAGLISWLVIPLIGLGLAGFLVFQGLSEIPLIPRKPRVGQVIDERTQMHTDKNEGGSAVARLIFNLGKGISLVYLFFRLNPALSFFAAFVIYLAYPTFRVRPEEYEGNEHLEQRALEFYSTMTIFGKFIMLWVLAFTSFVFMTSGGSALFTLPLVFLIIGFFIIGGLGEFFESIKVIDFSEKGLKLNINIGSKKERNFYAIIFYIATAVCCVISYILGAPSFSGDVFLIYTLMMFIQPLYTIGGILAGSKMHPKSLPMMGIMVFFTVFALLTIAQTGTVGQTLFGNYWPTVEHYGSMIITPIGQAYDQVSEGMNDAWLMMSCPTCYAQKQMDKQKVTATRVKEGGVKKSIELTEFKAINYGTGTPTIDPSIPLIGTIQLENQGEFTAKSIKVTLLSPKRKDPVKTGTRYDSDFDCKRALLLDECTYTPLDDDACGFVSCTGISIPEVAGGKDRPYQCEWTGDRGSISPGDIKAMSFVCGQDKLREEFEDFEENINDVITITDFRQWSPSGINKCECSDPDDPTADPTSSTNCECGEGEVAGYVYGKNYVAIKMVYEFGYDVTANGEVAIMDSTTYDEKLMRKEIRPTDSESKYSGGPVMISIWQQDQPLRSETESWATVSIFNNGDGLLQKDATLTVTIPKENIGSDIIAISDTLLDGGLLVYVPDLDDDYYTFNYTLDAKNGLEKGKSAKFTFRFKGNLDEGVLEKTTLITAKLDYTYTREKLLEFPIALIPAQ